MALQRTGTYRPKDIIVAISNEKLNLAHTISGYSEDAMVEVARNADAFSLYVGADDVSTRVENANTSANVTLTLQSTSTSNDILQGLHDLDRNSRSSDYMFNILIKDNSGRSLFHCDEAFIATVPNATFSNSLQTREWVIICPRMQFFNGGNARVSAADRALLTSMGVNLEQRWV